MPNTRDVDLARARAAYLLRGLWKRVDWESIDNARRRNIGAELGGALYAICVSERSTLAWARALCVRFAINPSGGGFIGSDGAEHTARPAYALIPKAFADGVPRMDDFVADDGSVRVRWDACCSSIGFAALRLALHENPMFFATFATAEPVESEAEAFPMHEDTAATKPWAPALPGRMISPRVFRTVYMLVSPFHQGADEKSGNVNLMRRQRTIDSVTNEQQLVPFGSGNSWRGALRDRVAGNELRALGFEHVDGHWRLTSTGEAIPPRRIHALFAGGTVEKGADGASVDLVARNAARRSPAWNLLAGCIDQQIMESALKSHDITLVCRENAWMLLEILRPNRDGKALSYEEFAAALPPADDLTQLRLGTRHAHKDLEGSDGSQMLWNTEAVLPGARLVHSFQLAPWATDLTKSCLAAALEDLREDAYIGAGTARGYGRIAFDPYSPGDGENPLPSPELYRTYLVEHADELRAWLLGRKPTGGGDEPDAKPAKGKRGSKKAGAEVMDPKTGEMISTTQGGLF